MSFWNVLLVIIVILAILLVVLYILGSRMQKRQAEQQTMIDASKQTVSILAIDKKKLKIGDSGLPKMVIDAMATDVDVWNLRLINDENEEFRYHGSVSTGMDTELDEISERLRLTTGKPDLIAFNGLPEKW